MIAIGGPSKRIAVVLTCMAVVLGVLVAVFSIASITVVSSRVFSVSSGSMKSDPWGPKDSLAVGLLIPLLIVGWVGVVVLAWIGRCFGSGRPSLLIQRPGLLFPCLPGLSKGRFIPWENVTSIMLLDESQLGFAARLLLDLNRLLMPEYVPYAFVLNIRARDLIDTTTILGRFYRINDLLSSPLIESGNRQFTVVELLSVPITGEKMIALLRLLLCQELRESVLRSDATRTVHTQDEMDQLLSDLIPLVSDSTASA